jgi:pyruvate/2-oxoglutarate/acetoin dehydrogenase E1 component
LRGAAAAAEEVNFLAAMNAALTEATAADRRVLVLGQLVKYGLGGLTSGLYERYPQRVFTYPVCENLMNASAMGLSLAGFRPVVVHERMDFLAVGMDPLVNHIPVWPKRAVLALPLVILAVVGKGKGQGPQHSKNLAPWFRMLDGWTVAEPASPAEAHDMLLEGIFGRKPVLYVAHREFFGSTGKVDLPRPERIGLCGASAAHEKEFYADE